MKILPLSFFRVLCIIIDISSFANNREGRCSGMADKMIYLQPEGMVFDALLDLMEMQKGIEVMNEPLNGKLHFVTSLYGTAWDIHFSVMGLDRNRCAVTAEVTSRENEEFSEIMSQREYALLDSMLLIGTVQEKSRFGCV